MLLQPFLFSHFVCVCLLGIRTGEQTTREVFERCAPCIYIKSSLSPVTFSTLTPILTFKLNTDNYLGNKSMSHFEKQSFRACCVCGSDRLGHCPQNHGWFGLALVSWLISFTTTIKTHDPRQRSSGPWDCLGIKDFKGLFTFIIHQGPEISLFSLSKTTSICVGLFLQWHTPISSELWIHRPLSRSKYVYPNWMCQLNMERSLGDQRRWGALMKGSHGAMVRGGLKGRGGCHMKQSQFSYLL